MYRKMSLALVAMGLAFSLFSCDGRTLAAGEKESGDEGKVGFRLTARELSQVGSGLDSIRLEATRMGYPLHAASARLDSQVVLGDMAPGAWSLKVALYDRFGDLGWSGDTSVVVEPGRLVEAVVLLHRASGWVRVRILLDSTQGSIHTESPYIPVFHLVPESSGGPLQALSIQKLTEVSDTQVGISVLMPRGSKPRIGSFVPMYGLDTGMTWSVGVDSLAMGGRLDTVEFLVARSGQALTIYGDDPWNPIRLPGTAVRHPDLTTFVAWDFTQYSEDSSQPAINLRVDSTGLANASLDINGSHWSVSGVPLTSTQRATLLSYMSSQAILGIAQDNLIDSSKTCSSEGRWYSSVYHPEQVQSLSLPEGFCQADLPSGTKDFRSMAHQVLKWLRLE